MATDRRHQISANSRQAETGCWEWSAYRNGDGYGTLRVGLKTKKAHRVSFEAFKGEVPAGFCVMHSCDNPGCVNPDHLSLGTWKDNAEDKVRKGRQQAHNGERNPNARLTADDVRAIRASTEMGIVLAARYGVTPTSISDARRGKTWGHL